MIFVTPHSRLEATIQKSGARHLISLTSPDKQVERPAGIAADNWLLLRMNDIVEERDGLIAPSRAHVQAALDFATGWNGGSPLVVSCYAGISRSTAIAYSIVAMLRPGRDVLELAQELRCLSPSATPNIRIIALADEILNRNGKMVAAISSIGRGADAFEGTPFQLQLPPGRG